MKKSVRLWPVPIGPIETFRLEYLRCLAVHRLPGNSPATEGLVKAGNAARCAVMDLAADVVAAADIAAEELVASICMPEDPDMHGPALVPPDLKIKLKVVRICARLREGQARVRTSHLKAGADDLEIWRELWNLIEDIRTQKPVIEYWVEQCRKATIANKKILQVS